MKRSVVKLAIKEAGDRGKSRPSVPALATGYLANFRTHFLRIIERAGEKPWTRLFHSLRASCETDLAAKHPLHVVTSWLGHTQTIALTHYLSTVDADFQKALGDPQDAPKARCKMRCTRCRKRVEIARMTRTPKVSKV